MPRALTLLDDVRWHGAPVVGDRPGALLGALVEAGPGGRSVESLVDAVWGDDRPANPAKALQVLVSRVRAATDARVVERTARGYRLGLGRDEVDVLAHADLTASARSAHTRGDLAAAVDAARDALALAPSTEAEHVLATALSRCGEHAEALPRLERLHECLPADDEVLAELLRSEAAVRGPAAALEHWERARAELAERLGSDPGPALAAVHRELLAADRPVQDGVHFDAAPLYGRDADVRAVRGLLGRARVVSIVGAGGLGKTTLAHAIGRDSGLPVARFVELAGVRSPEDVVGEVGAVIGVRESVSDQRTLTPTQRADVRARIARHLAGAPTLLILDNCEHVVDAAAELVAFLVSSVRDLRVLTTTRAPLAIAAEHVYPLGQLGDADATALFRARASAARPGAVLDVDAVDAVVDRLDGLPLAIELAAAKVRTMSVEDVRRRLDDRFALLRGGDRSAPDRHRTLLAVIEWSWNLLDDDGRRAWAWLSSFHDGFTAPAAAAVLGDDPQDVLDGLVDQSLLTVVDVAGGGVRFRMLETVREFGRLRLTASGDRDAAERAHRAWARGLVESLLDDLDGSGQFAAVDALRVEETNLTDLLRRSLADRDPETGLTLLAGLATFWSVRGDHHRVMAHADAVEGAIEGWDLPGRLADVVGTAVAQLMLNARLMSSARLPRSRALLDQVEPLVDRPEVRAWLGLVVAVEDGLLRSHAELRRLAEHPDRQMAATALQFLAHAMENDGDTEAAVPLVTRSLEMVRDSDGPWARASRHTMLAQIHSQLGHHAEAARHAREALPVLDRLDAADDAVQCRTVLAIDALVRGDHDAVQAVLDQAERIGRERSDLRSRMSCDLAAAELALARGDRERGLECYRRAIERSRALELDPTYPEEERGYAPWVVVGDAIGVVVYAVHGDGSDGTEYWETLRAKAPGALLPSRRHLDYPVLGTMLFGLGVWGLRRGTTAAADAVRLLVLAERFSYSRALPSLSWENAVVLAERAAPGMIQELRPEYDGRRGPDLLAEARAAVVET